MSRSLDDLQTWFRHKAEAFLEQAMADGIPLRVTRTLTTEATQAALYAIGRTDLTSDQKVNLLAEGLFPSDVTHTRTNAPHASDTPHGLGLAFDVVPMKDGQPWWDAPEVVWQRLYKIAERCGLDALGDPWGEFVSSDKGHFQCPGWRIYRAIPEVA